MFVRTCNRIPKRVCFGLNRAFGALQPSKGSHLEKPIRKLQFSKERLTDFGELPRGEIPEALEYNPQSSVTKTDNGITVGTEVYGSDLITVGFHWKYGSRNETLETSGITSFISSLRFRGTQNTNRGEVEKKFHSLGAKITQEVGRERNSLYITCHKKDLDKLFSSVSELITNSTFHENQLEAEREGIYRRIVDLQKDMLECTLENAFFTSFRDHQMGQPALGSRENVANITPEKIREFVGRYHTGKNLVVTATGNVEHGRVVELVNKEFKGLNAISGDGTRENNHLPIFTPSLMFMKDDEMANLNTSVFFKAPAYNDPESTFMKIFVELLGEYRADKHTATNLNDPSRQYNTLHEYLGAMPDIILQKTFYFPFSDVGIFASYIMGNEVYGPQLIFMPQMILSNYALSISQAEIFRARAKIFNDLLNKSSGIDTNREFAKDLFYLGRRVPRSELATKVSAACEEHLLRKVASKWFFDVDISSASWGPLHYILTNTHYNRPWKRSTLGIYGSMTCDLV